MLQLRSQSRALLSSFLVVVAVTTGCSKSEGPTGETMTIGPSGGTFIADNQHVRLDFPPGALSAPTEIRVTPTTVNLTGIQAGTGYALTPDGLTFGKPVTLTLHPPSSVVLDAQTSRIARIEGNAVQFDDNPTVDAQAQTISATLGGFSTHAVASTVTLCPEGCPSVPTVSAEALPNGGGIIRLTGSCSANGRGTTQELIIERAYVEGVDSAVNDFQNWQLRTRIPAPESDPVGRCFYQFDDATICSAWTYAYRVRAFSVNTTTNASNVSLALSPSSIVCTPSGGDGGVPDGGSPDGGSATVLVQTFQRSGFQQAVPTNAAWVGAQDGTGAFAQLTGQNGLYSFNVSDPAGRYGVAVACSARTPASAQVIQATVTEGADLFLVCAGPDLGLTSVSVQTSNCQSASFAYGSAGTGIATCGTSSHLFPTGTYDAIGISYTPTHGVDRVAIERGVTGPSVAIDFQGTGSATPETHRVNVGDTTLWYLSFITSAGTALYNTLPGPGSYPGFPAAIRQSSDVHSICTVDPNNPARTGYLCHVFRDPIDLDDSQGPYASPPIVTASDKKHIAWDAYVGSGFEVDVANYEVWLSIGWLGTTTSYSYPRLCDLSGFPLPCTDTTTDTQYSIRAFKPAGSGFPASIVDIQNAESLLPVGRDGLNYGQARFVGPL